MHSPTVVRANFETDRDVAFRSVLIKNMLEDVGDEDSSIPIPNVCISSSLDTFQYVLLCATANNYL